MHAAAAATVTILAAPAAAVSTSKPPGCLVVREDVAVAYDRQGGVGGHLGNEIPVCGLLVAGLQRDWMPAGAGISPAGKLDGLRQGVLRPQATRKSAGAEVYKRRRLLPACLHCAPVDGDSRGARLPQHRHHLLDVDG